MEYSIHAILSGKLNCSQSAMPDASTADVMLVFCYHKLLYGLELDALH
jgi:hypothetical protein